MFLIWKDIKGYEGLYQVSSFGVVRSLDRLRKNKKRMSLCRGRELVPDLNKTNGYLSVSLSKDGKATRHYLHRLVAFAFVPNPGNKKQVNHKDGDKENNRKDNLEWATHKENAEHAADLGLVARGWFNGHSTLTQKQVDEIRRLRKNSSLSLASIGRQYGVHANTVDNICHKRSWK